MAEKRSEPNNNKKKIKIFPHKLGIRMVLFIYFTLATCAAITVTIFFITRRLSKRSQKSLNEANTGILNQVSYLFDNYLRDVMKLSNTVYYSVLKNADKNTDTHSMLSLLYESNKEKVDNIALFSLEGELIDVVPAARQKEGYIIKKQEWFKNTFKDTENSHFSLPHLQKIFELGDYRYKWVISMSRIIEFTKEGRSEQAVLLIDMKYDELVRNFNDINFANGGYIYIIDSNGEIIWHPKMGLLYSKRISENNIEASKYNDGIYSIYKNGREINLLIKTVGYTGWKIVGVSMPASRVLLDQHTRAFTAVILFAEFFIISFAYIYMTDKISTPINRLQESVKAIESGKFDEKVSIGGVSEIEHLGKAVENMRNRINQLIKDNQTENQKRIEAEKMKVQAEFDVLQAQINPHFLYNTLSIIVWLIEAGKPEEATKVVTAVGRFFRIFLNTDKKFITAKEEIGHVSDYLLIQQMRFKDRFSYKFDIDESVNEMATLKLILQPIVENSIYHGMEYMDDGDGIILIKAYIENGRLVFSIKDNGAGMTNDRVTEIMSDAVVRASAPRGSGIGFKNVKNRIFKQYGSEGKVCVISEPDEGTEVIIHFPAQKYIDEDFGVNK